MNEENDVFDVCDFILFYEESQGRRVSNLRLQKLLYFIQAQFVVDFNEVCFNERIEAWHYGPVVPTVYRKYKHFGSLSINNPNDGIPENLNNTIRNSQTITALLNRASGISTSTLVDISHDQDPWKNSYVVGREEITQASMRAYFLRGTSSNE